AFSLGEFHRARALHEECLSLKRKLGGDPLGLAETLGNLGITATELSEYVWAQTLLAEAQTIFREIGDVNGLAYTLENLADVAYRQGELENAHRLIAEALTILQDTGNRIAIAVALEILAYIALQS